MSDPSEFLIRINQSSIEGYFCCTPSLLISQPVKAPDVYRCPAGKELVLIGKIRESSRTKEQKIYGNGPCEGCPLKGQCTTNKKGRRIKRYAMDDAKDALRQVMQHPQAKKSFSKRQAMVEPVFAYLRDIQGLNRFRRKGLDKVKLARIFHKQAIVVRATGQAS